MRHGFFRTGYQRFRRIPLWKLLIAMAVPMVAGLGMLAALTVSTYNDHARSVADSERLMNLNNAGVILLDRDGNEFYRAHEANTGTAEFVELADIPDHTIEALIATEDRNFYDHHGLSIRGTAAAAYRNLTNQDELYGGSTITQQLAKNTLLEDDRTFMRKYQELVMSVAIERTYEKDEILEMYLNSVYFGEGAFGIDSAAEIYFSKSASELTLAESSMLIGLLPAPAAWSPLTGTEGSAEDRKRAVLTSMVEVGYLSESERDELVAEEVAINPPQWQSEPFARHFSEMVMNQLYTEYGEEEIIRSGYRVTTTLDSDWQLHAEEAVDNHIGDLSGQEVSNGSAVIQDPQSGEIRALVGSRNWENEAFGKVNAATMPRQPGSSFKSIYYAEALDEGEVTAATILEDESTSFGADEYEPENFDEEYRGEITVRDSLAQSRNITSVEVMERIGTEQSVEFANQVGIDTVDDSQYHGLALALGTAEVPLLDMTNAYAAFANEGVRRDPVLITEIEDYYGENIFEQDNEEERVISEEAAFIISSILSDEEARSPSFAQELTFNDSVAVKTGTTDDNRDALTIGYTPNVAIGVWVGNNDNRPMSGITGSTGAAPIWENIMREVRADLPGADFTRPDGVVTTLVCEEEGLPVSDPDPGLDVYREFFIAGTVPDEECELETDEAEGNGETEEGSGDDEDGSERGEAQVASSESSASSQTQSSSDNEDARREAEEEDETEEDSGAEENGSEEDEGTNGDEEQEDGSDDEESTEDGEEEEGSETDEASDTNSNGEE